MLTGKFIRRIIVIGGFACALVTACTHDNAIEEDGRSTDPVGLVDSSSASSAPDTASETSSDASADSGAATDSRTDASSESDTSTETGADTSSATETDSMGDTGADTVLGTDTVNEDTAAGMATDATAVTDTVSDSVWGTDVDTVSDSASDTDADTDIDSATDTGAADDSDSDSGTEIVIDLKPGDEDDDGILDEIEIGDDPLHPLDSDNDGIPDFEDLDSDNDTIPDRWEGTGDFDADGLPAYRDPESDGDCIPDQLEAGDSDIATMPVDSDGDGQFDFLDLDSDNDGLPDALEDTNCNGIAEGGETSRIDEDFDNDGASDLVEYSAGTSGSDPADNPQANGDFVFVVPYAEPPTPEDGTIDFGTNIVKSDVVFAMDTTGSMSGEIDNLRTSLAPLIDAIRTLIPNAGFAVAAYDDYPCGDYGSLDDGDQPFYLLHRVMTIHGGPGSTADFMIQNAVNSYTTHYGRDGAESGWEMIHQVMTGEGTMACSAVVPAFDNMVGPPTPAEIPAGEEIGILGGVGFRDGALPIIIWITDAASHNSDLSAEPYLYSGLVAATQSEAINELLANSARVITVVSSDGFGDPAAHCLYAVEQSGAIVPPEAWGIDTSRPTSCAINQCCTGLLGAGVATNSGGECPLLFNVDGEGNGLGESIAKAVQVLATYGEFSISGRPLDDATDAVDAVAAFVDRVEANVGGVAPCTGGLITIDDIGADGIKETFPNVTPGTTVCFDVIPKMNTTVEPLDVPQMFTAKVLVEGDGVTELDSRTVYFLVPPAISNVPSIE